MGNSDQNNQLRKRLVAFTVSVVRLAKDNDTDKALVPIFNQIIRSAASVGANIAEASGSVSKLGFARYFHIALQSANETQYWLEVLREAGIKTQSSIAGLESELTEFIRILRSSLKTMRNDAQK